MKSIANGSFKPFSKFFYHIKYHDINLQLHKKCVAIKYRK